MRLHGYFRSGASWRVRIALALKGVPVETVAHHLRRGEQRDPAYLQLNPQGLVPTLQLDDGTALIQSLAIVEWLEETHPIPPLLPHDPVARAKARGLALAIAADTHPVQNLKVLARLRTLGLAEEQVTAWARQTNEEGLSAAETLLAAGSGRFAMGDEPGLVDLCIVPQMFNARRFGVALAAFPRLVAIEAAAMELPAFRETRPEAQADAE